MTSRVARQMLQLLFRSRSGLKTTQNVPNFIITYPRIVPQPLGALPRQFTTTAHLSKKGGKKISKRKEQEEEEDDEEEQPTKRGRGKPKKEDEPLEDSIDPYDLSNLSSAVTKSLEKLKSDIGKLPTAGKFNPTNLEELRIQYDKENNLTAKLSSLADVLPKGGRAIGVSIYNKEHIKSIMSAIRGATSLQLGQPVQNAKNPLLLDIPIPPPTKESRDHGISLVTKAGELATTAVKNERATMQKKFKQMKSDKSVRPDDIAKAHEKMEALYKKGVADITKMTDAAKAVMGGTTP